MSKIIFEIFTEEIPATLQKNIAKDYYKFLLAKFEKLDISTENISVGITLNRLVLYFISKDCNKIKLTSLVEDILQEFWHFFPRTMLYPQANIRWIRPIRSLYAVIDEEILKGEFFGLKLCDGIYVKKFEYIKCSSYDEYFSLLKKEKIVIDYNERIEFIENEIHNIDNEYNNYALINEIAGMSENITKPILDTLDKKFYILPFELIELVLRTNQRYVVLKPNKNGEIKFLIFCDKNTENVRKGHQKVITARLDDALFYWNLDEKIKHNDNLDLQKILNEQIFVDDITWEDYLNEQNNFASIILGEDNDEVLMKVKKLIINTKLDLITGVVREFPELQGIIGGYYFGYNFNPYAYDNSITDLSTLYYYFVDRIAYIKAMFQQGKQPTGSGDKYKVKSRVDDIVKVIIKLNTNGNISKLLDVVKQNENIYQLFVKRYQKHIESELIEFNKDIVKNIINGCIKALSDNVIYENVKVFAKNIQNTLFVKAYKRMIGYTSNCKLSNETNEKQTKLLKDILGVNYVENINILENDNIVNNINNYLNNTKVSENEELKSVLYIIQKKLFEKHLPVVMI